TPIPAKVEGIPTPITPPPTPPPPRTPPRTKGTEDRGFSLPFRRQTGPANPLGTRWAGFSIDPATPLTPRHWRALGAARRNLGKPGGVHGRDSREKTVMPVGGEVGNFEQTRLYRGDQNTALAWE